jgi:hypothetical protein
MSTEKIMIPRTPQIQLIAFFKMTKKTTANRIMVAPSLKIRKKLEE